VCQMPLGYWLKTLPVLNKVRLPAYKTLKHLVIIRTTFLNTRSPQISHNLQPYFSTQHKRSAFTSQQAVCTHCGVTTAPSDQFRGLRPRQVSRPTIKAETRIQSRVRPCGFMANNVKIFHPVLPIFPRQVPPLLIKIFISTLLVR
jgi:hypothetical protein